MLWLLDTNAWIHYLKTPDSPVRSRLAASKPSDIRTCSVVRAELLHGARKYGLVERRVAIVQNTLAPFLSLPFDDVCAQHYARLTDTLEQEGRRIGPFDSLIAAICVANDCTLVTANVDEFSRVQGLSLENWLGA